MRFISRHCLVLLETAKRPNNFLILRQFLRVLMFDCGGLFEFFLLSSFSYFISFFPVFSYIS